MSPPRLVPAVVRALDVVDLFVDGEGPRSVPQITAALGLPRSTAHELVQTLVTRNILRRVDGHPHLYDLGLHLFELGSAYASRIDLVEQAQAVAHDLMERCNETVHIATLDGIDVVYLVKVDSRRAVRMVSAVGRRLPAHCTAVGKVLLAGLSDQLVADSYRTVGDWITMTPRSIPSLAALLEELRVIRQRGTAFDTCESNDDACCVAAPVRDHRNAVVAGLSISVPVHRAARLQRDLAPVVVAGAKDLSDRLGHQRAAS